MLSLFTRVTVAQLCVFEPANHKKQKTIKNKNYKHENYPLYSKNKLNNFYCSVNVLTPKAFRTSALWCQHTAGQSRTAFKFPLGHSGVGLL